MRRWLSAAALNKRELFTKAAEWSGAITGVAGALSLALKAHWSGYGWVFMLLSNGAWISYAIANRIWSIFLMQLVYTTTSLVGIYCWLM